MIPRDTYDLKVATTYLSRSKQGTLLSVTLAPQKAFQ
jgi:hypothetical protein